MTSTNAGVDVFAVHLQHSADALAGGGREPVDRRGWHRRTPTPRPWTAQTEAYLGPQAIVTASNGTVTVESTSGSTAMVNTSCGSGALIAGDTADATALIDRNTLGHVDQGAQVTARA